jgi:hypothetical protein
MTLQMHVGKNPSVGAMKRENPRRRRQRRLFALQRTNNFNSWCFLSRVQVTVAQSLVHKPLAESRVIQSKVAMKCPIETLDPHRMTWKRALFGSIIL